MAKNLFVFRSVGERLIEDQKKFVTLSSNSENLFVRSREKLQGFRSSFTTTAKVKLFLHCGQLSQNKLKSKNLVGRLLVLAIGTKLPTEELYYLLTKTIFEFLPVFLALTVNKNSKSDSKIFF